MVSVPTFHFSWWAVWSHSLTPCDLKPLSAPCVLPVPGSWHHDPSTSLAPAGAALTISLILTFTCFFWHLQKFSRSFRSFSLTGFVLKPVLKSCSGISPSVHLQSEKSIVFLSLAIAISMAWPSWFLWVLLGALQITYVFCLNNIPEVSPELLQMNERFWEGSWSPPPWFHRCRYRNAFGNRVKIREADGVTMEGC